MKISPFERRTGKLFSVLGNPFRIQLLLAIGKGEACVCHLEALLGKRQAFISQHLMALRKAGLLDTRREGKFIYYRLTNHDAIDLIHKAGDLVGMENTRLKDREDLAFVPNCPCPKCGSKSFLQIGENKKLEAPEQDPA